MKQSKQRSLWVRQVGQARDRGIPFEFPFEEWVLWWEKQLGPNWMKLRGRRKDQYHMARFKDEGPYVAWNVECITNSRNAADEAYNRKLNGTFRPPPVHFGEAHPNSKLTELAVKQIYSSKLPQKVIAKRHGISWRTVHNIKHKYGWKRQTDGLGHPGLYRRKTASRDR